MEPIGRKLIWVQGPNFQGWACSKCAWVFNPSWPLASKTIDEMKREFELDRDKEFAAHSCAEHPRVAKDPG